MTMNALPPHNEESSRYLIEGLVVYSPQNNKITHCYSNESIVLLSSASECFLTLLRNHGKLVNKNTLINAGWEQYGLHVSDNTFYQNTLTLRRAIKKIGIDKEVIKTVPRKGLMIPNEIQIEVLPDPVISSESLNLPPAILNPLSPSTLTPTIVTLQTDEQTTLKADAPDLPLTTDLDLVTTTESPPSVTLEPPSSAAVANASSISVENEFGAPHSLIVEVLQRAALAVLVVCTLLAGVALALQWQQPDNPLNGFYPQGRVDGCQLFVNNADITQSMLQTKLKQAAIQCKDRDAVYAATHDYIQRFALVHCQHAFDNWHANLCTSYYFLEK